MDEFSALGLPVPPEGTVAHNLVLIGLVAIQDKESKKWCATHETRGWYMPAGRVDYGEGIETGSKREALEEAGVHVDLEFIVRLDFSPSSRGCRFRAIYKASLADDSQKLRDKSTADNEIIEACWVEPRELEDGRKVRSLEMMEIFDFVARTEGSLRVPADFVHSIDGNPIDHEKVVTPTLFSVTLMIFSADHNNIAVRSSESFDYALISDFMSKPQQFVAFAKEHEILTTCKGGKILGLTRLRYAPPHNEIEERSNGHMNVVIVAQVNSFPDSVQHVKVMDVLDKTVSFPPVDFDLVSSVINKQYIFPVGIIDLEGMPLKPFSPASDKPNEKSCAVA